VVIICDNNAARSLCKGRKEGQRGKHIDIVHHYVRGHVASGVLLFAYCKTEVNRSGSSVDQALVLERIGGTRNDKCLIDCSLTEIQRGVLKIMHGEGCACMIQSVWVTVRHAHRHIQALVQQRDCC
jgi:hypothetical protein